MRSVERWLTPTFKAIFSLALAATLLEVGWIILFGDGADRSLPAVFSVFLLDLPRRKGGERIEAALVFYVFVLVTVVWDVQTAMSGVRASPFYFILLAFAGILLARLFVWRLGAR
jgi:hypothetical protein